MAIFIGQDGNRLSETSPALDIAKRLKTKGRKHERFFKGQSFKDTGKLSL